MRLAAPSIAADVRITPPHSLWSSRERNSGSDCRGSGYRSSGLAWGQKRDIAMTKLLKTTFILHAIIATLFGAPLLVAPGAFSTKAWLGAD